MEKGIRDCCVDYISAAQHRDGKKLESSFKNGSDFYSEGSLYSTGTLLAIPQALIHDACPPGDLCFFVAGWGVHAKAKR